MRLGNNRKHIKRQNATLSIAQKWKTYQDDTRLYFESQGKELLEDYTRKTEVFAAAKQCCYNQEMRSLSMEMLQRASGSKGQQATSHVEATILLY